MDNGKDNLKKNVIRVGNSIGMTIPKKIADEMDLSTNSKIQIVPTDQGFLVTKLEDADPDFVKAMNDSFDKYHDTLGMLRKGDE
ncbi:AbrB/MazE/SpoVT family DNA-binding domain-containing protein [Levilactobacillus namurensis]|uniref:AbrB/MazE/SpoVT family DNA-binding domain-containing protein n=1 Tax=Levilactobacillus namurensis TaxID=380393 RepID=UPI00222FEA18|nr:AbrB/MazE/SpoVT family DNA-binding domain-containing protein [Levilactobacillus namurensis]MCW3778548.1 AbrB/MazE/SpoVT family DNA-binding domain-containing protein [Levilactobacillus namurensis]MDT7019531.1 AbrB/MazE/SpoVT family DNA-binding domain-containing protein [Levilactobacillus namurensis]WNN65879.1 AbrB/MazE/SpoVT family DNA-binding domain-containing protein [Levilactobacillus namurensis]